MAIALGWQGHVDSNLSFSAFFERDHTLLGSGRLDRRRVRAHRTLAPSTSTSSRREEMPSLR